MHWTSRIKIETGGSVVLLGDFATRRDVLLNATQGGKITVGDKVFFNNDCRVNCRQEVSIGDRCMFGESVLIYDHNHGIKKAARLDTISTGFVRVENDVWVGSMCVITKNVCLGSGAVIGAGNCLRQSVPADKLYIDKFEILDIEN